MKPKIKPNPPPTSSLNKGQDLWLALLFLFGLALVVGAIRLVIKAWNFGVYGVRRGIQAIEDGWETGLLTFGVLLACLLAADVGRRALEAFQRGRLPKKNIRRAAGMISPDEFLQTAPPKDEVATALVKIARRTYERENQIVPRVTMPLERILKLLPRLLASGVAHADSRYEAEGIAHAVACAAMEGKAGARRWLDNSVSATARLPFFFFTVSTIRFLTFGLTFRDYPRGKVTKTSDELLADPEQMIPFALCYMWAYLPSGREEVNPHLPPMEPFVPATTAEPKVIVPEIVEPDVSVGQPLLLPPPPSADEVSEVIVSEADAAETEWVEVGPAQNVFSSAKIREEADAFCVDTRIALNTHNPLWGRSEGSEPEAKLAELSEAVGKLIPHMSDPFDGYRLVAELDSQRHRIPLFQGAFEQRLKNNDPADFPEFMKEGLQEALESVDIGDESTDVFAIFEAASLRRFVKEVREEVVFENPPTPSEEDMSAAEKLDQHDELERPMSVPLEVPMPLSSLPPLPSNPRPQPGF